ncbi:MAG: choice-of-anchor B family protein, partial [Gammaproteobacteria bacterium]|nr:choice-of-anchor B family protein [Gammaproteobacteria bacterium]
MSLKSFLLLATAVLGVAGAWACPVPHDADSAYHTLSRLAQIAPRLGVKTAADKATRDPTHESDCDGGLADVFPCSNVDLLSYLPMNTIGGGEANDIWGWTDPLTGNEYALVGKTNGTAFVDITDPGHAEYLGMLPTHSSDSLWRDVKTHDNHAFIVSEASGHGIQVFDLTELRGVAAPRTFSETTHYDNFGAAHNIAINEQTGFAYAVGTRNNEDGCGGGLHMVDISRPASPEFAGCYSGDGYTHDTQCVVYSGPDVDYQGKEVCFNYNEDTLTIVDVSNKAAPILIERMPYAGSSYTHQGWLTEDQIFLLLDDEGDELSFGHNTRTFIWDVSDLDAPEVLGSYLAPTPAIDHNLYVKGDFAYQANYRAGMRIIDLSNIATGTLVQNGFFDVYPPDDAASFNGSWSVFPYFDSGVVIVSGIEQGLFVLRPTALEPGFMLSSNEENLSVCGDDVASVFLSIDPVGSYTGTVTLEASGAPAGATISFAPSQVAPPGNAIVSANVSGAEPGVYPITVTGDDGTLQFDQPLTLELSQNSPGQPSLLLPTADATAV